MHDQQDEASQKVTLCDHDRLGRMEVELQGFFELSFEIAEHLEDLVAQFQYKWGVQTRRRTPLR